MSEVYPSGCAGTIRSEGGHGARLRAADWAGLAAAPTFAIMALITGVFGAGQPDFLCSAAQGASPLSGMPMMYLLMSAVHLPPWLKLVSSCRTGAHVVGADSIFADKADASLVTADVESRLIGVDNR